MGRVQTGARLHPRKLKSRLNFNTVFMRYLSISEEPKQLIILSGIYPDSTKRQGNAITLLGEMGRRGTEGHGLPSGTALFQHLAWWPHCEALPIPTGFCTNYTSWNHSSSENNRSQIVQWVQTSPWFYLNLNQSQSGIQHPRALNVCDLVLDLHYTLISWRTWKPTLSSSLNIFLYFCMLCFIHAYKT